MTRPAFRFGPALLFCPADRPDRYAKALDRADAVILDLEDAVDEAAKAAARDALVATPLDPERVIVRLNPADGPHRAADLAALARTAYRTVMLAKCEDVADLSGLERYEAIPLCETARGVLAAPALAAQANVSALMWGAEDLVSSLGGSSSRRADGAYRETPRAARVLVQLAAAAHGAVAIDAVHLDLADLEGQREEAEDAAALGFAATACVHPSQVEVVRAAYRPGAAELERARAVLAAAEHEGGVFRFRGVMVDEPVLRQARAAVRRAEAGSGPPTIR
ncbi:HpcH/HpaI aldolase/citrate lyase family protein [Agromyces sp. MMS24-K17]|uniref:HpcH/HpaI aldolase/citrate lyase family protein n=1 Tax=Agromyces sp. MMS24-K17 TaxID=3372850 RepID=UPI00375405A7